MAAAQVFYFQEDDATVPIVRWLEELHRKVRQKCLVRLARLEAMGHELRRPEADYLRDDIYELRASHQGCSLSDALFLPWYSRNHCLPR